MRGGQPATVRVTDDADSLAGHIARFERREGRRPREVMLCNTSDCYAPGLSAEAKRVRRDAICALGAMGIPVCILSKSYLVVEDLPLLATMQARVGMSITSVDPAEKAFWEPHASVIDLRFEALALAHESGIKTWISAEPLLDQGSAAEIVRRAARIGVDEVWFGRMNYHSPRHDIDLDLARNAALAAQTCAEAEGRRIGVRFKERFSGRQVGAGGCR